MDEIIFLSKICSSLERDADLVSKIKVENEIETIRINLVEGFEFFHYYHNRLKFTQIYKTFWNMTKTNCERTDLVTF